MAHRVLLKSAVSGVFTHALPEIGPIFIIGAIPDESAEPARLIIFGDNITAGDLTGFAGAGVSDCFTGATVFVIGSSVCEKLEDRPPAHASKLIVAIKATSTFISILHHVKFTAAHRKKKLNCDRRLPNFEIHYSFGLHRETRRLSHRGLSAVDKQQLLLRQTN